MKCRPLFISKWKNYQYKNYKVIIATTFCQKQQGFQFIKFVPANTFLLFNNILPGTFFHTRNCNFPLDIIALDSINRILGVWSADIDKNSIGPMPSSTKKVIETHAGWIKQNQLKIGDVIPFIKI